MSVRPPHFLLHAEASALPRAAQTGGSGGWRFVLEPIGAGQRLEASDCEPDTCGERLELLALVRGLEALDQPSRVTLVTHSRYVRTGLAYGLDEWRTNGWCWEHFGEMSPVKNRDLWQRIDRALRYHDLECRMWRFDEAHGPTSRPRRCTAGINPAARESVVGWIRRTLSGWRRGSQLAAAG
jgi:ribonuclease HI